MRCGQLRRPPWRSGSAPDAQSPAMRQAAAPVGAPVPRRFPGERAPRGLTRSCLLLRHQYRDVIRAALEIAIQDRGDETGMADAEPRIGVEIPARAQPIGM